MPVILGDEASIDIWLNGASDTKFSSFLKPYEKADLVGMFRDIVYVYDINFVH